MMTCDGCLAYESYKGGPKYCIYGYDEAVDIITCCKYYESDEMEE